MKHSKITLFLLLIPMLTTAKDFCFACYEDNLKIFTHNLYCEDGTGCLGKLVKELDKNKVIAAVKKRKLKRTGDFYEARVGVLIHEQCFEKDMFDFDIEAAISESYIKGMVTLLELFEFAKDDTEYLDGGAVYKNHIPGLVREFDRSLWKQKPETQSYLEDYCKFGELAEKNKYMKSICKSLDRIIKNKKRDYNFHPKIQNGNKQNKILCQAGLFTSITEKEKGADSDKNLMAASGINNRVPAIIKWKRDVDIYSAPFITIKPEKIKNSRNRFMSFIWHENHHVIGQKHNNHGDERKDHYNKHVDFSVFCQVAIFWDEYVKDILDENALGYSAEMCVNTGESTEEINRQANIYRSLL